MNSFLFEKGLGNEKSGAMRRGLVEIRNLIRAHEGSRERAGHERPYMPVCVDTLRLDINLFIDKQSAKGVHNIC